MKSKAMLLSDIDDLKEPEALPVDIKGFDHGRYLRQDSGDLVFLGGRPGNGKTLLALQLAYVVSKYAPVLFFSLEMTKEQLKYRLQKDPDFDSEGAGLYIYSEPSIHINSLVEEAHAINKEISLGLIVVDYTQIVQTEGRTKAEEVGSVVTRLKELGLSLSIPVLALAQLNRNIESRETSSEFAEPQMSDFADSAEIEKWADCCLILHRIPKADGVVKVHCVKNRHGAKKDFLLKLNRHTLRFEDEETF